MNKADQLYKELVIDIYNNGVWDKNEKVRTIYADGTPAYTKSVFGRQVIFEEGVIPLLTSKFVGWKTALKEMLLFWSHQTVKKEDFEAWNVRIWDEWFKEDGTLGKSYAYQFESMSKNQQCLTTVEKKTVPYHGELSQMKAGDIIDPNWDNLDKLIGEETTSPLYGKVVIVDVFKTGVYYEKTKAVKIQFLNTGYTTIVQRQDFFNHNFKDKFARTVCGVGYLGNSDDLKGLAESEFKYLKGVWNRIIDRCYNKDHPRFKDYGGKGIFVSERWHSLENFLRDVRYVPQFFLSKRDDFKGWHLDKDYFSSNCYSLETCVWLKQEENAMYSSFKPYYLTHKNNSKEMMLTLKEAHSKYGLDTSSLSKVLRKKKGHKTIKGFRADYVKNKNPYRYTHSNNQVVDLINNIKNFPMSRRLMTSFWNDADVGEKALQECAMQTTWNVRDGKLDLLLYSRSVDSMLGLPYNWIQYWFLLQMLSQATGLKAGRFIHQMGNVHYYDRHEDVMIEQLDSPTFEQPKFLINPEVDDFFQFTPKDIKIEGYKHGGRFNYEVAI